jgi:hypothetical protein
MLDSLNRYFAAWLATLKAMFTPWVWGPFLLLAGIQCLLLWLLVIAPSPTFGGWPIELLRYWFGPAVGHYPAHLVVTPYMFFRLAILLYGIFGIVAYAMATGAFARKFTGAWDGPGNFFSSALKRYLPLFVIWLVTTGIIFFALMRIPEVMADWTYGSPRRDLFVNVASRIVMLLFMSFWAYTTVLLIVERSSLLTAVRTSCRRFLRHPMATFFLLGIPYAITIPFSLMASKSAHLAQQFRPETIVFALILVIITQFVAMIITCGSVTYFYLTEPARE